MRCEDVMTSDVEILRTHQTVREAARRMRDLNLGFLPICDDSGELAGVLTDRDITVRVVAPNRSSETAVEQVMTDEVVTCSPDDDVRLAEQLMRTNQKSRLVCVDDGGHVAGIISLTDLVQYED